MNPVTILKSNSMEAMLIQPKSAEQFRLFSDLAQALKVSYEPVNLPRKKRKTGLDLAWKDVKAGRINEYSSSAELFAKLGI